MGVSVLLALLLFLTVPRTPSSTAQQNTATAVPKPKVGRINIDTSILGDKDSVTLTLIQRGKVLVMSDFVHSDAGDKWDDLEPGDYEVRCEAVGKQTLIKHLLVPVDGETTVAPQMLPGQGQIGRASCR